VRVCVCIYTRNFAPTAIRLHHPQASLSYARFVAGEEEAEDTRRSTSKSRLCMCVCVCCVCACMRACVLECVCVTSAHVGVYANPSINPYFQQEQTHAFVARALLFLTLGIYILGLSANHE
jgi:hypothetical protein